MDPWQALAAQLPIQSLNLSMAFSLQSRLILFRASFVNHFNSGFTSFPSGTTSVTAAPAPAMRPHESVSLVKST